MSDTPRTDAEIEIIKHGSYYKDCITFYERDCEMVAAEFGRQLEREVAELRENNQGLHEARHADMCEIAELREALAELADAMEASFPPEDRGHQAQVAWAVRREGIGDRVRLDEIAVRARGFGMTLREDFKKAIDRQDELAQQVQQLQASLERAEHELSKMTEAYENMRAFARANGLDTTATQPLNRRGSE